MPRQCLAHGRHSAGNCLLTPGRLIPEKEISDSNLEKHWEKEHKDERLLLASTSSEECMLQVPLVSKVRILSHN